MPFKMECPACGHAPGRVYKCTVCHEVRCGSPQCKGTSVTEFALAASGIKCRACHKGQYNAISSFEMLSEFLYNRQADPLLD